MKHKILSVLLLALSINVQASPTEKECILMMPFLGSADQQYCQTLLAGNTDPNPSSGDVILDEQNCRLGFPFLEENQQIYCHNTYFSDLNNLDTCPNDPNKTEPGTCGCGVVDTDSDGDGTADCNDECSEDPSKIELGTCGCGVADTDSDGNGTPDCQETKDHVNNPAIIMYLLG